MIDDSIDCNVNVTPDVINDCIAKLKRGKSDGDIGFNSKILRLTIVLIVHIKNLYSWARSISYVLILVVCKCQY